MTTPQQTADWLTNFNNTHGFDGVVHEVNAVLIENANYSAANHRSRKLLGDTATLLLTLYDQTGQEKLLDAARDIRRLIEWADSGQVPVQLSMFPMPEA